VTVVANGHVVMARFDPGVVIVVHNVTIGADLRGIAYVGEAFCIKKSVRSRARGNPNSQAKNYKVNTILISVNALLHFSTPYSPCASSNASV